MQAKRDLVETTEEGSSLKKQRSKEEMEVRALISNKESGTVIGKAGANVSAIREQSQTFINILKNQNRSLQERVLEVKGEVAGVVKALAMICSQLSERKQEDGLADPKNGDAKFSFKLLVHQQQAGAIIGKGGAVIKEMQESTGCRVQLSNAPLEGSTDKSVSLAGSLEQVQAALSSIVPKLYDHPIKPGLTSMPYVPGGGAAAFGANPYGAPQAAYSPYSFPPQQQPFQTPSYLPAVVPSGPTTTEKVAIPTARAGSVIGKAGSVISGIKGQSGTTITIADPEPAGASERIVSITGSQQGIELAIFLIKQKVEVAEQAPARGGGGGFTGGAGTSEEKLAIPTASAGAVIGKRGAVITDIKAQSGCRIQISDADPSSNERIATISGTPQGIQIAIQLIRRCVEQPSYGGAATAIPSVAAAYPAMAGYQQGAFAQQYGAAAYGQPVQSYPSQAY